jgi:predicted PurR-regulated permease PerM
VFPLPAAGMEFVMMDKKPHIKPYLYGMLAGFGAISLSIIFFFLIYRFDGFGSAISTLTGILMPFIYGAVIAYLLKPVCNTIEAFLRRFIPEKMKGLINALSVTFTILFGLLLIYALCMMIIPQLITSVTTLYYTAQANITKFMYWANHLEFIEKNEQIMELLNSAYAALNTNLDTWIKNTLLPSMQNILSGAALGVLNVVVVLKNLVIGIIVAVYMLASRKRFVQQGKMVLYSVVKPRWASLITEEVKYADKMFGGFINGKILDSAIIGVLCYIGCLIFKFPSALLVSVIIGVTNVIPFFGPFIGAIPATLLILIQNPIKALWFVLFVLVLQQLDGNIIGPKILGNTTGLSSFWVLFAILLFGGLWGFVGMIIGVPLFAVIYDVIKKLVFHGLNRNDESGMVNLYHDAFGDPDDE